MQSADNAPPNDPLASLPMANPTMKPLPSKQRGQPLILDSRPLSQPEAQPSTPIRERRTNPSAASLFRSTLTPPPGSRSGSPASMGSPARSLTGSVFGSGGFKQSLLDTAAAENPGDPLNLILKSFVPHIAIHDSEDVEHLVKEKGFKGGLFELLRPFGERVQGRVIIRDSNGASRTWDDFSVRFTKFGEAVEDPDRLPDPRSLRGPPPNGQPPGRKKTSLVQQVEQVVEKHLGFAEEEASMGTATPTTPTRQGLDTDATSPYYALYIRRLLSGIPMASHETFSHPVACVIAISSRHPAPIEALRQLYSETTPAEQRIPPWIDGDFLRYYVLIHDEERSDITKSMQLFDQMKRHFGLHCHLLRIRSSQSAQTDDDSIPLPRSDWMSASEELADIERSEQLKDSFDDDPHLFNRYIFESDATAIRTFIREMVIQSIIPTMERNVSLWNDQVASRRRGISGRFMSLSKRFTMFGSSSSSSSSSRNSTSTSSNGFDTLGYYRPDTPEAIMRRLADFAFMLRDWKLAMSTYDLLRSDFQNDKAWKYHASANEMAALSLLIMPQNMSSKNRVEIINPMVEQALYSYHTRCSSLYGAVRSTLLSLELLRLRGGTGIDESVRWGTRLLEMRLLGPIGDALLRERLAVCYASKGGTGSQLWGSRRRKSAMWSVLAAQAWVSMGKYLQAQKCLADARSMYSLLPSEWGVQGFNGASEFLAGLNDAVRDGLKLTREYAGALEEAEGGHGQNNEGEGLQFDESSNLGIPPKATGEAPPDKPETKVQVDVEQDGFNGQSTMSSQQAQQQAQPPGAPPQIPTPTASLSSSSSHSPEIDSEPVPPQSGGGFENAITPTPTSGNSPTRPRKASMAVRASRVLSAVDLEQAGLGPGPGPGPLSPLMPARLASGSGSGSGSGSVSGGREDSSKSSSKEGKDGGGTGFG
ncbi:ER-golgi trafficking TRAPP I complex 85 kDa subunit-domain-containing protein [Pseudoneurospora amorphoporcata]|uniref:ER-golgi trafficking TRAPP I complex 85 kDa subunit-domain-containing protein n=1 Tax=Pseudoneurospora amorphoporcata TaxID=241081 RepID=A0AAN6SDU4_9PEZI|nr:ER-golgi trafficking TRAPP I complex 85 kDa subunit-domain-containing protein [Pseudoneurospora amorphoporcata]